MKLKLNAVTLQIGLAILMAVIIGLIGAGFYYASQMLSKTAQETARTKIDIDVAQGNTDTLKRLQTEMEERKEIIARTEQIVSDTKLYQYQDQIVKDINQYASKAGVSVGGYSFASDTTTLTAPTPGTTQISGVKKLDATITLNSPIRYDNFLKFIIAIEENLTKMQITGIDMAPDSKDTNAISNPTVGLQIYVRG